MARFTLDSAGQFLFGGRIDALRAGIPYPYNSGRQDPPSFTNHASNAFVNAFSTGLRSSAMRYARGQQWPLWEIGGDLVKPQRDIMDGVIDPVVVEALKGRELSQSKAHPVADVGEGQTLLTYLASQTRDPTIIKDEVCTFNWIHHWSIVLTAFPS